MLSSEVSDLLTSAARRRVVLLASDFDGVLAPLCDEPTASTPAPAGMAALRRAATLPDTIVALVSGRDLASLSQVSGVGDAEPIVLIGSHGGQSNRPDLVEGAELSPDQLTLLDTIRAELDTVVADHPGSRVEIKATTAVLHVRGMDDAAKQAALAAAREVGARHRDAHAMNGKDIVELSVVDSDKGTALRHLGRAIGADVTIYLGDDVTDEKAFAKLDPDRGDVTIKVGDGATAAIARVEDVPDVVAALETFVDVRAQAVP